MGWREDVKFGIARASRFFYGDANGGLGTEVTFPLDELDVTPGTAEAEKAIVLDASADLTSGINDLTIDNDLTVGGDLVVGGSAVGSPVTIITDDTLTADIEWVMAIQDQLNVPLFEAGAGGEGKVCVADFLRFIRATTAEQALGSFSYALVKVGDAPPGTFSLDPTSGVAANTFSCSDINTIAYEVWVEGPGTDQFFGEANAVIADAFGVCP